jgi:hypothetical protein
MSVTGDDLIAWLKRDAVVHGGLSEVTARQYATAVRAVLAAQPEGLRTDLDALDLGAAVVAFRDANRGRHARKPPTVDNYVASFSAAVRAFLRVGEPAPPFAHADSDLRYFSFPLRRGLNIDLHLPGDLTRHEAERLAQFVMAIAISVEPDS